MKKYKKLYLILAIITIVFIMLFQVFVDEKTSPEELLIEMEESFGKDFDIVYNEEENQYELTPSDEEFNEEVTELYIHGTNTDQWSDLLYSFATYTEVIEEETGKNIGMIIFNPYKKDQALAIIRDGNIVYDFVR